MTKAKLFGLSLLLAAAGATSASAQNMQRVELGPYIAGGYNYFDFDEELGGSGGVHAITARAGWQVLPILAVEAEASFGLNDDGFDFDGNEDSFDLDDNQDGDLNDVINGTGDLGMDYLIGFYGRTTLPLSDRFLVSARAGYAFVELDSTFRTSLGNIVTREGSDDGFAVGADASYALNDNALISVEYTHYEFGDANAESLGAFLKFRF